MKTYEIIKAPIDTEKTNLQKELDNKVSFEVDPTANRVEIRKAVEKIFDVKVKTVRTMHVRGKIKRRGASLDGRKIGKRLS